MVDRPWALEVWRTMALVSGRDFALCLCFFSNIFFEMVKLRLYFKIRIRSFLLYPHSSNAFSADGGRVESCVRQISWVPISFHVHWCGFWSLSSDLWLSSLAMVIVLVRRSFRALARRLPARLVRQTLLWESLAGSSDGGARTSARHQLALVSVVVVRWSKYLFVITFTFGTVCTHGDDY
jgi:hypothetical protein